MTLEPGNPLQPDESAIDQSNADQANADQANVASSQPNQNKQGEHASDGQTSGEGSTADLARSKADSTTSQAANPAASQTASPAANTTANPQLSAIDSALNRLNNAEKLAKAKEALAKGQTVFERGRYKKAIALFQTALALANPIGGLGGEIQMWLVNAYIAAGDEASGLALCRKLIRHPDLDTKQQSKRLLYILEAPELEMNPDWVTKIPDLNNLEDERGSAYIQQAKKTRRRKKKPEPEPLDLSEVETDDNQFIWIALIGILLTLSGLFWLS
ncbi:MAG: hypothetical protein AAFP03_07060 [Cyanobacteria bacterium J06598_3]